jgi:uncharacterized OB-fold protein
MNSVEETGSSPYLSGVLSLPQARPDGLDRPFFDAAREHRLVVQRCNACGSTQFPPEVVCTACQSHDVGWHEVAPVGTLTSFARVWHPVVPALIDNVPYLVGVVEVAPGARLVGNIVGDPRRDDLVYDMRVDAVFEDHDDAGVTLIQWRPA